uniref:RING-H2 finger protein ATL54-like n=1 Tax=Erigeron canadensis TaxID=72917 RepID=UPI001CB99DE3|nr:RING-H2 finger protein ATL54-like [Erigeron canadensis]
MDNDYEFDPFIILMLVGWPIITVVVGGPLAGLFICIIKCCCERQPPTQSIGMTTMAIRESSPEFAIDISDDEASDDVSETEEEEEEEEESAFEEDESTPIVETKNRLKEHKYNDGTRDIINNNCVICMEGFEENETVQVVSSCQHPFHTKCIYEWLYLNPSCPICRVYVKS